MISSANYHTALEKLPAETFEAMVDGRAILVIAPHPDDESLGCGGLLAWGSSTGRRVEVVFLTDGEASHPGSKAVPPIKLRQIRMREAVKAGAHLGVPASSLNFLHLRDGSLPWMSKTAFTTVAKQLRQMVKRLSPCMVYVTSSLDPHGDHQKAYELALAAVYGLKDCHLLAYPVWSWVLPDGQYIAEPRGYRVDIRTARESKANAIAAHASQHGCVVPDSSAAFVLPKLLLERLDQGFEVYLEP